MPVSNINSFFEKEVENCISTTNLKKQNVIVVAVSGGQDSMAMLNSLYKLSQKYNFTLHGAHLNHQLREVNSSKDAEFVKNYFRQLNIPYTVESMDVSKYKAAKKLSMEEAARELRYQFLSEVALKSNTNIISLGHTLDDQVETILMNIIRGCGLNGLKGMGNLTTRKINSRDFTLFRPLLNLKRSQTLEYCKSNDIPIRIDETNTDIAITRNRVRIELIPYLQTFNPSIKNSLLKLSKISSSVLDTNQINIKNSFNEIVSLNNSCFSIDIPKFNSQNTHIKTEILIEIIKLLHGGLKGIENNNYHDLISLIANAKTGSKIYISGFCCLISYNQAFLYKKETEINTLPILKDTHKLIIPGEVNLGKWKIKAKLINISNNSNLDSFKYLNKSPYSETFDISLLESNLHVRTRRPGDKFVPLGMNNSKKLKDFMIDSKIPFHHRDRTPLVCTTAGIIWVVGWRISNWAKLKGTNKQAIQINFNAK